MKDWLEVIVKTLGLVLFVFAAAAFVIFFGMWFLLAVAAMVVLFGIAWLLGVPITVKQDGQKVGYIRWTKFYRTPGK